MGLFKTPEEKRLIELQNFLFNTKEHKLTRTKKQIIHTANVYYKAQADLLNSTLEKVGSADDLNTLFDNEDKTRSTIAKMKELSMLMSGYLPALIDTLNDVEYQFNDILLPDAIDLVIEKNWEKYNSQVGKHSTESDRTEKMNEFFEEMGKYSHRMKPQNIEHINELRSRQI